MKRSQSSDCGGCGGEERWLVHNVRHKGTLRHLCTSCVLKTHVEFFCPVCFQVFESGPLKNGVLCSNCTSATHPDCARKELEKNLTGSVPSSAPYVCPPCSNPNFVYFNEGKRKKVEERDGSGGEVLDEVRIDGYMAKVLVAAAKIAAGSMCKAALAARVEAERRVNEAGEARKKAREALELVLSFGEKGKEKEKEKEKGVIGGSSLSNVEGSELEKKLKAKIAAAAAQKRVQNQLSGDGKGKAGGGVVSLSNGDLKEKEGVIGSNEFNVINRSPKNAVSGEARDKLKEFVVPVILNEKNSSNLSGLHSQNVKGEKEKNSLVSAPVAKHLQFPPQGSHEMDADGRKLKVTAETGAVLQ